MLAPHEIADFTLRLKREGFSTSLHQTLAAQDVVQTYAQQAHGPEGLIRLATYIRPLFCSTPDQQAQFDHLYLQWLRERGQADPSILEPDSLEPSGVIDHPPIPWWPMLVGLSFVLGLLLSGWFLWQDFRERTVEGRVVAEGQGVAGATVAYGNQAVTSGTNGEFTGLPFQAKDRPFTLRVTQSDFLPSQFNFAPDLQQNRSWLYVNPISMSSISEVGDIILSRPEKLQSYLVDKPQPPTSLTMTSQAVQPVPIPSWRERLQTKTLGLALLPLVLALAVWVVQQRRTWRLQRQTSHVPPDMKDVGLQAGMQQIFPSLSMRQVTQRLRHRQFVESPVLDVERTIQASINRAGFFWPMYGSRQEPGYLAFIERATMADHQAHMAAQIVKSLAQGAVWIHQYEFDERPTRLHQKDPLRAVARAGDVRPGAVGVLDAERLEQVQVKHGASRLLYFADPLTCFHPGTGELHTWVEILEAWEERFFFTTNQEPQWGQAEHILSHRGFHVLPLSSLGLQWFSHYFQTGPTETNMHQEASMHGSSSVQRLSDRWLERYVPSEESIKVLLDDLETLFLQGPNKETRRVPQGEPHSRDWGRQGLLWLAGCAAYPEIHWGLTLEWGARLFPANSTAESQTAEILLPHLTQLVWFRQAFMPDWFRQALYDRLTPQEADQIQQELQGILEAVDPEHASGLVLAVGLSDQSTTSQSGTPSSGRAHRDYVTLQYLSGRKGKALAPAVTTPLFTLLYPEGKPWLGYRMSALWLAAIVGAVLLGWWGDLIPAHVVSPIQQVGFVEQGREVVVERENGIREIWTQEGQVWQVSSVRGEQPKPDQSPITWNRTTVTDPSGQFQLVYHESGQVRLEFVDGNVEQQVAQIEQEALASRLASLRWVEGQDASLIVLPTGALEIYRIGNLDAVMKRELDQQENNRIARERQIAIAQAQEAKRAAEQQAAKAEAENQAALRAKKLAEQEARQQQQQQQKVVVQEEERPARITGKDGAPMVLVPAGEFTMGAREDDKDAQDNERPAHQVYLDAFYLDQYEVTTSRYAKFFEETKRQPPEYWSETVLKEHSKKPVVGVDWNDAQAYCEWAGKRLPTEAEWEKAARGTEAYLYPWGDAPPNQQLANFDHCCQFKDYEVLTDVGSFEGGKSPNGVHDMAGNVWEWVNDWYAKDYYRDSPVKNPPGSSSGTYKVLRGGSWINGAGYVRSSDRDWSTPTLRNGDFGFRCAQGAR